MGLDKDDLITMKSSEKKKKHYSIPNVHFDTNNVNIYKTSPSISTDDVTTSF